MKLVDFHTQATKLIEAGYGEHEVLQAIGGLIPVGIYPPTNYHEEMAFDKALPTNCVFIDEEEE